MSLPSVKGPNDFPFKHSGNPDQYGQSVGGNVGTVQTNFDSRAEYNQTQINSIITALTSTTLGDDGAGSVALNRPTVTANNVGGAIEELKTDITNAMIGVLPLSSVTYPYLGDDVKTRLAYNDKAIAEMEMFFELSGRLPSPNNNKLYTDFINTFTASMGTVDATSQVYTGTLSSGATSVAVTSSTGFAQGQEISVQDGVGYEDVIILSVVGNVITFTTPLVNTYTNPRIYRSNNNGINFGSAGTTAVTYDRTTPVQVVNSAYTTSASARPQVLSNGWIVTCVNTTTQLNLYKSTDNGATFTLLGFANNSGVLQFSMTSYGTKIYLLINSGGTNNLFRGFDALNATGGDITTFSGVVAGSVDTGQTSGQFSGCSIAINSTGTTLTAAWSSKNATYPNSFNIRSAKSTDGGVTWTKQDGTAGVDQLTVLNTSGRDNISPNVVYMSNGNPNVFYSIVYSADNRIMGTRWTGSAWSNVIVYGSGSDIYTQSSPSATVQKYGANVGRIEVVWVGFDATDTSARNVRYSYSDDLGVTWSVMSKLTSGNTYEQDEPSCAVDQNGDLHVAWRGLTATSGANRYIRYIKKTSGVFGAIFDIVSTPVINRLPSLCDNYYNFEKPLMVFTVNAVDVKFYGKWTVGSDTPTTKNVIRMNIRPYLASKYIQAWLTKSEITGFTVDGKASFRTALTDNEVYIDLVETTTDLGSTNEISMSGINATTKPYITLKLILNRASTGDNAQCTRLIGGVSA